ncbi:conserved hypothetical protein [Shewanella sediminis HAW-EB3]|uniref:Uncharacterized protein n=1 Tax=Shewanella sediminis (strain HAW-EB3) TaxID=425104 RepID=A8FQD2_SHESH|nr:hypothetical protein [Shewanella sediminis]ABV35055.1 conserved hypothetical protein [Shewanella sediminis HAW-EB3]
MRYLLLMITFLITACGGGGDDDTTTPTQEKLTHPGLSALDIRVDYSPDGSLTPVLSGSQGNISFSLADGAANDVVRVNQNSLTILNVGQTKLIVTDSGNSQYKATSRSLNVSVDRASRDPLLTNNYSYPYAAGAIHQVGVSGAKGQLLYELSTGYPDDVVKIDIAGSLIVWGEGQTQVTVKDDGGRNYQASESQFSITVEAANSQFASYRDITNKPLVFGGTLLPVYSGSPTSEISYAIAENASQDVVQIHPITGVMNIKGAGETEIVVSQTAEDNHQDIAKQTFKVRINKADNTDFIANDLTLPYGFDDEPRLQTIGAQGTLTFEIVDGESTDVINFINSETGQYRFSGIGETKVKITDSGNRNYLSKTVITTVNVERVQSVPLSSVNLESAYQQNKVISAQVASRQGKLSFSLAKDSATDVVSIDALSGEMTVLKPGKAEITVTDDGDLFYIPQTTSFFVTINKLVNDQFSVDDDLYDNVANTVYTPVAKGSQGPVTYAISANSTANVLSQDPTTKVITLTGAGRGWITATDHGNDYYQSQTTDFIVDVGYADGTLKPLAISAGYAPNKVVTIPVSGVVGQLSSQLERGQPDDVVNIDIVNRTVTIKNAGTTYYTLTDSGSAAIAPRRVQLRVTIAKAAANVDLSLTSTLIDTIYEEGKQLSSPAVSGSATESTIKYYVDYSDRQVVTADSSSGALTIKGAGSAQVQVTEVSRNFEDTTRSFTVNVGKAKHPGLTVAKQVPGASYYPGLEMAPAELGNQFGELSFKFTHTEKPETYELTRNGTLRVLKYAASRTNTSVRITVTDDGGDDYLPSSVDYDVYVNPIEEGTGEKSVFTFDGTELSITSPIDVAAGDVTYFSASDTRSEAETMGDNLQKSGGYATQRVTVCHDPSVLTTCTLVTVRLQNTSHCPDGSKIAYPVGAKIRYECPGLKQPINSEVMVSFDKTDLFNPSLAVGTYQALEPITLVHFAKPYRAGGVIEMGDIQARAWWLIKVNLTVN